METNTTLNQGEEDARAEKLVAEMEKLGGKILEKVKKFTGGEEEWVEWSEDLRMIVDMQAPKLAKVMKHVENHGEKAEDKAVKDLVEEDVEEYQQDHTDMARLSHELYRWLVLVTEGEAKSYSSKVVGTTMAQQRGAECMPSSRDAPLLDS